MTINGMLTNYVAGVLMGSGFLTAYMLFHHFLGVGF